MLNYMLSEPVEEDRDDLVEPAFHLASPFKSLSVTGNSAKGNSGNARDIATPVKKVPNKVKAPTSASVPAEVAPENNALYARINFRIHEYLFTEEDNFLPKLQ